MYGFVGGNPASKADPDGHAGPGDVLQVIDIVNRFASNPGGFIKSFLKGSGKQEVANINMHEFGGHDLKPNFSNDVERAGGAALNGTSTAAGYAAMVVGSGKGEGEAAGVQANRTAGLEFEGQGLAKEGLTKNTTPMEAVDPKTGQTGTTVPDAVRSNGQTVDFKNVQNLSDSPQLRRQSVISARSGQKGQVIAGPRNRTVSKTVQKRMEVKKEE